LHVGRFEGWNVEEARGVPEWEEYPHTPGVFVRVANKGLAGYGTWKSIRKMGDRLSSPSGRKSVRTAPPPVFFVSVASKGFSRIVSLLFATLAGVFISVAAKGLKAIVGCDFDRVGAA
jgi:hypothetical protein